MAESFLRYLYGNRYEVYSAGAEPSEINPYAIRVMAEIGIDIPHYYAKSVEQFRETKFDYVVTVCDHAKETYPFFPEAKKYLHKGFHDPSDLNGEEDEVLNSFRRLRTEMKD